MKLEKLEKGHYYHIFNRGINGSDLFKNDKNKIYFLELFKKYLTGKVSILAYCLMQNHYHFVVRIDDEEEKVTQSFSNFFNAYAKAFNKSINRTGSLFEKHFKRKRITDEDYLRKLIIYVHTNPVHHRFYENAEDYRFSSLNYYLNTKNDQPEFLNIKEGLQLFNDLENFKFMHNQKFGDVEDDLGLDLQGAPTDPDRYREAGEHLPGQGTGSNLQGMSEERAILVGLSGGKKDPNERAISVSTSDIKTRFLAYIHNLQDQITSAIEKIDGKATFHEDPWEREEGGGGRTRVIENGDVIEKGGVNISQVHGPLAPAMQRYFKVGDVDFFACGLSLVLHPKNPYAPTVHANWRYFEMYEKDGTLVDRWFGGGQDLTPYYLFDEDAQHFHQLCKTVCDKHDPKFYPDFKEKCDAYFYNAHRKEGRGIGGLFFDYCKAENGHDITDWYAFVTDVGDSFLNAYLPILKKRMDLPYGERETNWQQIRRGRYVEFNLVHDKGTLFGLKTNGRIESILMSLPPLVQWKYDYHPEVGSEEEKLLEVLQNPKKWA